MPAERVRRNTGRYFGHISNPVINAVADLEGTPDQAQLDNLRAVCRTATRATTGRAGLALLFGDLLISLTPDYMAWVLGYITAELMTVPEELPVSSPGKYDSECRKLQAEVQAQALLMIVLGGKLGHGVSVAIDPNTIDPGPVIQKLPEILHAIADGIARDGVPK